MPTEMVVYRIKMSKKDALLSRQVVEFLQERNATPPGYAPVADHLAHRFKVHRQAAFSLRYGEAQLLCLAFETLRLMLDKTDDPRILQQEGRCLEMLRRLDAVGIRLESAWQWFYRKAIELDPELGKEYERELRRDPSSGRLQELERRLTQLVRQHNEEESHGS